MLLQITINSHGNSCFRIDLIPAKKLLYHLNICFQLFSFGELKSYVCYVVYLTFHRTNLENQEKSREIISKPESNSIKIPVGKQSLLF